MRGGVPGLLRRLVGVVLASLVVPLRLRVLRLRVVVLLVLLVVLRRLLLLVSLRGRGTDLLLLRERLLSDVISLWQAVVLTAGTVRRKVITL